MEFSGTITETIDKRGATHTTIGFNTHNLRQNLMELPRSNHGDSLLILRHLRARR